MPIVEARLRGKRILVTLSTTWLGPALCKRFSDEDATLIADPEPLTDPDVEHRIAALNDSIDVVVINTAVPAPQTRAAEVTDAEWRDVFAHLVDPLPKIIRAVLPGMVARKHGKIIVIGSAAALRGIKRASTYSAARGAQAAYVRAVGTEVAAQNVHVNLIAPNFVDDPMYFPPEVKKLEAFQQRLKSDVPVGRMGDPASLAAFAAFLASDDADFFAGQCFPFSGGWVT